MIEERRNKSISKTAEDDDESSEEEDKGKVKRMKNLEKAMKYHSRKRRDFKQREPLPTELEP